MSRKNRKTRTATTTATDGDRHLHAVSDAPGQQHAPTTEDKVRAALNDNPRSTTATVAMVAGVGRSTAAKILARWGRDGTAIRTEGDGPRNPDTWALATPDHAATAPDTEDAQPDPPATPSTDEQTEHTSDSADTTSENTGMAEEAATDVDETTTEDTPTAQVATTGSEAADPDTEALATDSTDDEAGPSSDDAEHGDTSPLPDTAPGDPADKATETEPSTAEPPAVADTTSTARPDKDRLPKGGLRALVEEYLTKHAGESFGPAQIGKDLGRSGGAVNNALEKLVDDGYAIKTCEAPKRFSIDPDKTDVSATAEDADEPALEA